jgi:predicted O-linked N-acetylglucosamine transferase (SPINDLY family)
MTEHPDLIRAARRGLRSDVARSPLCDMNAHARALEEAYRAVWRLWCEDQSASS